MSARVYIATALGLALSLHGSAARAQETPVPQRARAPQGTARQRLVSVRIEPAIPGEDPWSRVALPQGVLVDDDLLRAAVDRAVASGTFADVRATVRPLGDGIELVLRGERRTRMLDLRFEGQDQRPLEAVRADFGLSGSAWVTHQQLAEASARLVEGYRAAGFRSAIARASFEPSRDPDYSRIRVEISEGEPTRAASLRLFAPEIDREFGPRLCDELSLWTVTVADREAACRPLLGDGEIAEARALRTASEQLRAALRRLGYYNARIDDPAAIPLPPRNPRAPRSAPRVELRFTANLGPAFSVAFEGVQLGSVSELREALRLEDERGIEESTLSVIAGRARDWYARRAFADARVEPRIERVSATRARLVLRVTEGAPVYVRTVSFAGAQAFSYQSMRDALDELLRAELPGGSSFISPSASEARAVDSMFNGPRGERRMPLQLVPERTFVAEVYQDAARRMVARYRENGYLDATVELDGAPHRDRDEIGRPVMDVTFRVVERAVVRLLAVTFEGNASIPSASLAEATELRLAGPVSLAAVSSARDKLSELYRERGYNYARVASVIDRSPNGESARVRFIVTEGPLVRISRVDVRGLRAISRSLVYDRLAVREGEVFRPSLARESQRRLGELGYFSAVTVSLADPDVESSAKTLVVLVSETGGSVEARGGVSFYEPLRGSVQWTRRNVLRSSVSMTASLQAGLVFPLQSLTDRTLYPTLQSLQWYERLRGRAAVSLQLPPVRALGTDFRPGIDLALSRSVDLQFAINGADLSASATIRPQRWVILTPIVDVQINDLQLFSAESIEALIRAADPSEQLRLARLLLLPRGTTFLTSAKVTAALDRRDQVFNPQNGFFLSLMGEVVGVLGFIERATTSTAPSTPPGNTLRGTATFSGYVSPSLGLLGTWTFATNLRVGINGTFDPCNRVTYPNRQFFLGGADTMRGWLQDSLVPADVLAPPASTGCANIPPPPVGSNTLILSQRSGDAFILWRNEVRIPIGSSGLAGGLFVDVGNLWKDLRNVFSVPTLRFSPGVGVRYITPIGPVGIDLGFNPFPSPATEPVAVFSFSFSSV